MKADKVLCWSDKHLSTLVCAMALESHTDDLERFNVKETE